MSNNLPDGPQCRVLRWMRRGTLKRAADGRYEVGGKAVSRIVFEGMYDRGLIECSDGDTTYRLTAEGRKWAERTESKT